MPLDDDDDQDDRDDQKHPATVHDLRDTSHKQCSTQD